MADRYLIETSATDGYLLEDGSGVLLLEDSPYAPERAHMPQARHQPMAIEVLRLYRENQANEIPVTLPSTEESTYVVRYFNRHAPIATRRYFQNAGVPEGVAPPPPDHTDLFVITYELVRSPLATLRYGWNQASDAIAVVVDETNTNFIAKHQPVQHDLLLSLRQNIAADDSTAQVQPETNTHFLARHQPWQLELLRSLRENVAPEVPVIVQPETNPHFIARFTPHKINVLRALHQHGPKEFATPETNVNFIAKHQPFVLEVLPGLRQNIAADFSTFQTQAETNTHFIAKHQPAQHEVLRSLRENMTTDAPPAPQPDLTSHFVPRHTPTLIRLLPGLRQNIAADFTSQFENTIHFVARYTSPQYRVAIWLRTNPASDPPPIQPETNTNFIARFSPHRILSRPALGLNTQASDFSTLLTQPSTPTNFNFIGVYKTHRLSLLPLLRMNSDFSTDATPAPPSAGLPRNIPFIATTGALTAR